MASKRKQEIIIQIEQVINEYNQHIKIYGDIPYPLRDAEEERKVKKILTKAQAVANRAVIKESPYSKAIEKDMNGDNPIKGKLTLVIGSLAGLFEDLKKDYVDISETTPISLKYELIIEDIELGDEKYQEIINEINGTYQDYYFTSMYVLIRKLLENLIYDCLKSYYGTINVNKYYNTGKDRHHGFGTLITNFNEMINDSDFKRDIGDVEQGYIDLLKEFQEKGNKNAHSLFNLPHQDFIENRKVKINIFIKKLKNLMS